ncbi:MAG TPA: circularly permuted type 2 ATP-grasp protein [Acidimicrobiales bacterium]|nr:circularly permuted type 2 ATP-grasp protein [Acidimicrobiales bacterium]
MGDDLFSGYTLGAAWDEMFESVGQPRAASFGLYDALRSMSPEEFEERCAERDRSLRDRGVTFAHSGEELPFPLDPVPRLIDAEEWATIEAGVAQRVRALELFLRDVYGAGEVFSDGVVPRRLVLTSRHYQRASAGVEPPNHVRIHVAGIDLVRDREGAFRVLEDNVRVPSGSSYVVENRRTMARIFPELFASHRIRPVANYPQRLLTALRAAAPLGAGADPTVVVLTPGVHNSAYFEHSFLARQMGVELVEGRDLVVRHNVVYMRMTAGERRVDVIYRRVDDDYLDPVHFRPESLVGCAGVVNAARAGNVTVANAIGNGVADDKLLYTYVPELISYYLGQEPILANVDTYRLEDPDQLAHALGRLDRLVVKPVDGSGGYGLVVGPTAGDEELAAAAAAITAAPRDFIAQEFVDLSTVPTKAGSGLVARHVDLRPFAVNDGTSVWVAPGGLTRVALREGSSVVNSSQGGGSKDTWVLAPARPAAIVEVPARPSPLPAAGALAAAPEPEQGPGFGGTQQQQQQQQQPPC